jgi:hypothetical protein
VRYLKIIEKSGYQALPWVRYITQNGGACVAEPSGEGGGIFFAFSSFNRSHLLTPRADYQIRTS